MIRVSNAGLEKPMSELNRRDFARNLTAGLAGVSAAGAALVAAEDSPAKKSAPSADAPPMPDAADGNDEPKPDEPREIPEAAWTLGLILKRYPDERLDEAAIQGIVGDIHGDIARSKMLSNFPLKNSDEPGYLFRPWRAAD